jgi:hypothetical protein
VFGSFLTYRIALLFLSLGLIVALTPQLQAQTESACSTTLGAGAALQPVLNNAFEGAVICLSRGMYFGPVLLAKSVTLRGVPADRQGRLTTVFQPSSAEQQGRPVLIVSGPNEMMINLENLSISDSNDSVGLVIAHGKTVVNLKNSEIARQGNNGITVDGTAKLNIINSHINDNLIYGLLMLGTAEVMLMDSTVSGHKSSGGILVAEASHLTIINSQIKANAPYGVAVAQSAHATVRQSSIFENDEYGMSVNELSSATIEDSRIFDNNRIGLIATGNAELKIHRTHITNHSEVGLAANDSTGVFVSESVIARNYPIGVIAQHSAELQMSDTQILDSRFDSNVQRRPTSMGLFVNGFATAALMASARAEIDSSEISRNGLDPVCESMQAVCTGALLGAKSQLKLTRSRALNNADWGIAVLLKKCGFSEDTFSGVVDFQGSNLFENNNQSGKHQGEICLP